MKRLLLLGACLWSLTANAQSIRQSGNVTPGHVATWVTTGVVADGGLPGAAIITGASTVNNFVCIGMSGTLIDCGVSVATFATLTVGTTPINGGATNGLLYNNAAVVGNLATGNNGALITSAGGVPSISSTLPVAVQGNITSLGTIASGVWNGTTITVPNGGTGLASGTSGGIPYFSSASTIASSSVLASGAIMLGGGAGGTPTTGVCTEDATATINCTSSTASTPNPSLVNTTADAGAAQYFFVKNRSGGAITTGDLLGTIEFFGFANGGNRGAAVIQAGSTGTITGSNVPSFLKFYTSNAAGLLNQTLTFDNLGHLGASQSVAPTVAACTGFSLGTGSTDLGGRINMSSGTTCSFNFGGTFTNTPACVVSPGSAASTHFITTSTTQLAVTFGTAQTAFSWNCIGN